MPEDKLSYKKKELQKTSEGYKHAIEEQIKEGYRTTERVGKVVLITGAILLGGYTILKLISGGKKKKTKIQLASRLFNQETIPVQENSPGQPIKEQIVLFLVSIALKKLKNFFEEAESKNESKDLS
ncbi:MAG: hypothetical protein O7F74_12665 [Bacteroidetes bacterium]|nr:hypothetical protein [Bacteroidota bacterium]